MKDKSTSNFKAAQEWLQILLTRLFCKARIMRNYFFVERFKWVNLEWLDDGKNGVKYTECEPKDAKWQLRVEEPRYKWMKWFL